MTRRRRGPPSRRTPEMEATIRQMRAAGAGGAAIGAHLGVSKQLIYRWLAELGLPVRWNTPRMTHGVTHRLRQRAAAEARA